MDISKLIPFSYGLVIEDHKEESYWIKAIPIELHGFHDGEIEDKTKDDEITGKDYRGEEWSSKYNTTLAVSAKWISRDSNRRTAPSIHKGEYVQLYKYADSNDIFWEDLGQNTKERTTERQVISWSNKPKRDGKELDSSNSYYMEVSTTDKLITLKTNKNNDEPFEYTIQVNTKEGKVVIEDDVGNNFYLDSEKKEVTMENEKGCLVQLLDKDINIEAIDNLNIKVGKKVKIEIGEGVTTDVKEGVETKVGGNVNYKIDGNYDFKVNGTSKFNTNNYTITSSVVQISGQTLRHNDRNVGSTHTHPIPRGNTGVPNP